MQPQYAKSHDQDRTAPIKVLLAEDEASFRMMVERRLTAYGYDVMSAVDGEEALNMARRYTPNVIVMDIMMPKMNGDLVAARLLADPQTARIPVIFLTCLVSEAELSRTGPAGSEQNPMMLAKPLESGKLDRLIRELVETKA